tara:strand:+ start:238 stop:936 length:699 start_codon:yes stop_codon:yes gene_type:complete
MLAPAVSANTDPAPTRVWHIWSRGVDMSQGSAKPFQTSMSTVSAAMSALGDESGSIRDQFERCKRASTNLRALLVDVYPDWTHRPNCTMTMPDAREDYVYGLYNYARAKSSELMARANIDSAGKRVLAMCMLNAAHQKLVAAQLMGSECIALEAYENLVEHHLLYCDHFLQQYDATDHGVGPASANAARAVQIAQCAGIDVTSAQRALDNARSRNVIFEKEEIVHPMSLRII